MAKTGSTKKRNTTGTKKKSTSAKSSTTKKKTAASKKVSREEQELWYEVGLIVLFTFMLFLFLCNFGLIGPIGKFFKSIMFGLFGFPAYLFPAILFGGVFFGWINREHSAVVRKLGAFTMLYILIGAIYEFIAGRLLEMDEYNMLTLYTSSAEGSNGGGIFGGSIAYLFYNLLDSVGSILLILVLCLICVVIMTEKSFIKLVQRTGQAVADRARTDMLEMRTYAEERAKDREEAYLEKKRLQEQSNKRKAYEQKPQKQVYRQQAYEQEISEQTDEIQSVKGINFASIFKKLDDFNENTQAPTEQRPIMQHKPKNNTVLETVVSSPKNSSEKAASKKQTIVPPAVKPSSQPAIQITRETAARFLEETDELHELRPKNRYYEFPFVDLKESIKSNPNIAETLEAEKEDEAVMEAVSEKEVNAVAERESVEAEEVGAVRESFASERESDIVEEISVFEEETDTDTVLVEEEESVVVEKQADIIEQVFEPDEAMKEIEETEKIEETYEPEQMQLEEIWTAEQEAENTFEETDTQQQQVYQLPPVSLLNKLKPSAGDGREHLEETANRLQECLHTFGVNVTITEISQGPAVTRYELQPEQGVKVSKIVNLSDDIKLNLAATDIRIEAPIPGKSAIGIEVPNKEMGAVGFRELIESEEFEESSSKITFAVGKDIAGKVVVADIAKMPHMLIAGATGSGKSVCINTIIMSILYKARPDEVQMIMIDPKVVELSVYNDIPHLLIPVVTDPRQAASALQWGVNEMMSRYNKFTEFSNVRDIKGYNAKIDELTAKGENGNLKKLPRLVIVVDELADLMMVAAGEVEESICRLAQLARAAGIHLIIATQRPSVDVITGLIKANMPSRVAFAVSSGVDSRTILDMNGAEKLLGKGDMLFYPQGYSKPVRVQGAFVSDSEVGAVVDFLKNQKIGNVYQEEIQKQISNMKSGSGALGSQGSRNDDRDVLFAQAGRFLIERDKASIGMVQRGFKVGFNRAARIIDQLYEYGVIAEGEGTKSRKVLMSMEQFENLLEEI